MRTIVINREGLADLRMCLDEDAGDPVTRRLLAGDYASLGASIALERWVSTGLTLVDIGANVGCFSLVFGAKGHPVLAVEASPQNARLLSQSAAENDLSDLHVHNVAVSDRGGSLSFCEAGPFGFVAIEGAPKRPSTTEVTAVALDQWPAATQLSNRVFIKMDIEGYEVHALRGMRHFLEQRGLPPMFVESNGHCLAWFGETPVTLCRRLCEVGYTVFRVEGNGVRAWGPQEPQIRVVENLLCVRVPDDRIDLPSARPLRPRAALLEEIRRALQDSNPAQRAYLARAVTEHPDLANDADVMGIVAPLREDPTPAVRDAVRGWVGH